MRLAVILSCLSLSKALSTTLSTSIQTSLAPQSTIPAISDVTYYGLYKIVNCRANVPARLYPEAVQLREFLGQAWNSTRLLLTDITNGTNSKFGFGPLFKTNDTVRTVTYTIRSFMNGGGNPVPTFLCLDDYSKIPLFQSLYKDTCTADVFATVIPKSSYIGLCPGFFEASKRNLDFPIQPDCPTFDTTDTTAETLRESTHPLMHNMYPIFLSQMLKLHMQMDAENEKVQVHHIQDCINLNATASLTNVANWANYAACKHLRLCIIGRFSAVVSDQADWSNSGSRAMYRLANCTRCVSW